MKTSTTPPIHWPAVIAALALLFVGCAPIPPTAAEHGYPPDFSLVFTVKHDDAPSDLLDPLAMPAQHVVSPDRTLRVALGPGAGHDFHPAVTARLSPQQMIQLYRIAEAGNLLDAPPHTDTDVDPTGLHYRITLTAHGYRRHYTTTPTDHPAATMLLERLIKLRTPH
ncbi:hypothetical protein ACERK3_00735 [Phycisphaerales bacterium AB-hyl4]|uniref:Lipoprotein n=1 Tax=Natronomicrosphaera hydrolytica TaxID=3242702 RepID=A0ABV4TZN4_9BACT